MGGAANRAAVGSPFTGARVIGNGIVYDEQGQFSQTIECYQQR
jgi:hypothetical protein